MKRETFTPYLPLLKILFVGLLTGSLIAGGLTLNAVILTLLIGALLVASRADVVQALIVLVIGIVIVMLFPQFSLAALDPTKAILCIAVILFL